MNDPHAERIIRLLEEIRDGHRLQQRERLAGFVALPFALLLLAFVLWALLAQVAR
jgi:hypothetical protein